MVESLSLQLVFSAASLHGQITQMLVEHLQAKGFDAVTASSLNFLGTLECGVNYGSEIARRTGVSRQMVAKTVKEMCRVGYLEQKDGKGKQKEILFTQHGENLMAEARKFLFKMDLLQLGNLQSRQIHEIYFSNTTFHFNSIYTGT